MIYLITLILILIGIYYYDYKRGKNLKQFYWIFICLLLICICGFRYRLGTDTPTYMAKFDALNPLFSLRASDFESSRFAPGFIVFFALSKQIYPDFSFFQILHAIIFNSIIFYFIQKYSRNKYFAVLIYYFFLYFIMSFQQLREALAVCVFLLAWPAFRDRKWLIWYLASLIAFSFHLSSSFMFVLPIITLPFFKQFFVFGKRTLFICLGIVIIGFVVQKMFFKYLELLALTESITERAQAYSKTDLAVSTKNIVGSIVFFLNYAFYPLLVLLLSKGRKIMQSQEYLEKNNIVPFVLISIYISILTLFIPILGRYNNYFFPFVIIYLSNFIFKPFFISGKRFKLNLVAWMMFFLPLFVIQTYNDLFAAINKSGTYRIYMQYYPYNSIFDKQKDEQREKVIRFLRRRF